MNARRAIIPVLATLLNLHAGTWPSIEAAGRQPVAGELTGDFPSLADIYDARTGTALLVPDVPLSPPRLDVDTLLFGIVDSGVAAAHPQLRTLVVAERAFAGSEPQDTLGHGTLVALQLIRGYFQQALGGVRQYPAIASARVTDDAGQVSVDAVIAAIDWLAEEGAHFVNLSLGFRGSAAEYPELCNAIARHTDVLFIAAAGNFGPDVEVFPAACPVANIVSVGETRDGMPAATSGRGDIYAPSGGPFVSTARYHLRLGGQAAERRNYAVARREFAASVAAERNVDALFQLALLDIIENDLRSAVGRLVEARSMEPGIATLATHLGAVRFLQGRLGDAESLLREALALDADDQIAHFNLGLTLARLGRLDEALAFFERLSNKNADYPGLRQAIADAKRLLNAEGRQR